ncbi:MAG: ABC transporter substrate-binding protein [Pseudomonadota bacterium]
MSRVLQTLLLLLFALPLYAGDKSPVLIGLDGEFGLRNSTSAQAIERGALIAMDEINRAGGVLGGRPLELVSLDNRSVPARGLVNLRKFAAMPGLVAVLGGRFSPVLLEQLPLIHELKLPMLAAWSAADGVTDHNHRPSYTFRLSLRDSYAMPVMIRHAEKLGATKLGLMVPNTGWGRSNAAAARAALGNQADRRLVDTLWYNWGEKDMLRYYNELRDRGAEAILLVSNDLEGAHLLRQMEELEPDETLPIIAHWGVTGGNFPALAGPMLHRLDFSVVQTFSLFRAEPLKREPVMAVAQRLFDIERIAQVESPVGFGHAYDLVHILARAIERAGSTERSAIRDALEQVRDYRGLTGDYPRPFSPERHDALRPEQVFMARYREDGVIVPLDSE